MLCRVKRLVISLKIDLIVHMLRVHYIFPMLNTTLKFRNTLVVSCISILRCQKPALAERYLQKCRSEINYILVYHALFKNIVSCYFQYIISWIRYNVVKMCANKSHVFFYTAPLKRLIQMQHWAYNMQNDRYQKSFVCSYSTWGFSGSSMIAAPDVIKAANGQLKSHLVWGLPH